MNNHFDKKIGCKVLLFYIETLKVESNDLIFLNKLKELYDEIINDTVIYSNYCDIDDPLILTMITMLENETKDNYPKINKDEIINVDEIARRYWRPSPARITKSTSEDDVVFRSRRNSRVV
jgi:hypothetical protein